MKPDLRVIQVHGVNYTGAVASVYGALAAAGYPDAKVYVYTSAEGRCQV